MRDRLGILIQLFALLGKERNWFLIPIAVGLLLVGLFAIASAVLPLSPLLYPFL